MSNPTQLRPAPKRETFEIENLWSIHEEAMALYDRTDMLMCFTDYLDELDKGDPERINSGFDDSVGFDAKREWWDSINEVTGSLSDFVGELYDLIRDIKAVKEYQAKMARLLS